MTLSKSCVTALVVLITAEASVNICELGEFWNCGELVKVVGCGEVLNNSGQCSNSMVKC